MSTGTASYTRPAPYGVWTTISEALAHAERLRQHFGRSFKIHKPRADDYTYCVVDEAEDDKLYLANKSSCKKPQKAEIVHEDLQERSSSVRGPGVDSVVDAMRDLRTTRPEPTAAARRARPRSGRVESVGRLPS